MNESEIKTHVWVDLPNLKELQEEVIKFLPEHYFYAPAFDTHNPDMFENLPELRKAIEFIGKPFSDIYCICVITCHPHIGHPLHRDNKPDDNCSDYMFNIPIYNCEKTYVNFYTEKPGVEPIMVRHGAASNREDPYPHYLEDDVEVFETVYTTRAALINTMLIHGGQNTTDENRIIISIRYSSKFDFELDK
jgi:hypothetical protein